MTGKREILVLGAYGLAGRAIVERLVARTSYPVLAAGRNPDRLYGLVPGYDPARIRTLTVDVADDASLRAACSDAAFIINAVGPFARTGLAVARAALDAACPCIDCANEQTHYRNLQALDEPARQQGIPLITAAGVVPGVATLLTARLLQEFPTATEAEYCWAQFRHTYAESGLASMMGGILEAVAGPTAFSRGEFTPIVMGRSSRNFDLPKPFGSKRLMEIPTIDALTLPARFPMQEFHTWFYMGDLPTWLLDIVRVLQPARRPWAYRLVEMLMRRINDHDTAKAIATGIGPECLLQVTARNSDEARSSAMMFRDGAVPTACLPVYIVDGYLRGGMSKTGLLTPLDLLEPDRLNEVIEGALAT